MIIDYENEFSDGQAITADAISEHVLDLGANPTTRDIGVGHPLWLVVQCDTTFDNLTDIVITLESDSTADLATSATVHITSDTILLAALVAGANLLAQALPHGDYERYLGVRYNITGTAPTAGALSAFLTQDPPKNVAYPDAL